MRSQTAALLALLLAACSGDRPPVGVVGHVEGSPGAIVSPDPRAALVARDVLSAGGSAADAAVALYFVLAVTQPASAGLGGGGACVVAGAGADKAETLVFLPGLPSRPTPPGRVAMAIPGNARGFFALHARYGHLRWEELVRPAERAARFGFPPSRALVADLAAHGETLDDRARRALGIQPGRFAKDATVARIDLAQILTSIRTAGVGAFYSGAIARRLAEAAADSGLALDAEDLRAYRPAWRPTVKLDLGHDEANFADTEGGRLAAALWRQTRENDVSPAAAGPQFASVLIKGETTFDGAAFDDGAANGGSTGFAIVGREGGGVACGLTMNAAFGTGRGVQGTGMIAARPLPPKMAERGLVAMVVHNRFVGASFGAIAATGSPAAAAGLTTVLSALHDDGATATQAVGLPRLSAAAQHGVISTEQGALALATALRGAGQGISVLPSIARVAAVWCRRKADERQAVCDAGADPRGYGYAVSEN